MDANEGDIIQNTIINSYSHLIFFCLALFLELISGGAITVPMFIKQAISEGAVSCPPTPIFICQQLMNKSYMSYSFIPQ